MDGRTDWIQVKYSQQIGIVSGAEKWKWNFTSFLIGFGELSPSIHPSQEAVKNFICFCLGL
jgi:hypothetical protein